MLPLGSPVALACAFRSLLCCCSVDMVCPAKSAYDLHKVWPKADYKIIPDAGHSCKEEGIISALVEATDKYRDL